MLSLDGIIEIERAMDSPGDFERMVDELRREVRRLKRRGEICDEGARSARRALALLDAMCWRLREDRGCI